MPPALAPARAVARKWIHQPWHDTQVLPIAAIKAWSQAMGLAGGPVRTPLLNLSAAQMRALYADVESAGIAVAARPAQVA